MARGTQRWEGCSTKGDVGGLVVHCAVHGKLQACNGAQSKFGTSSGHRMERLHSRNMWPLVNLACFLECVWH